MAYSKYGLSFKNFTDSYGEWEANGGVEQANKAIDFKNLQNNSFNVRGLPGGTFGQSVIDSALGTAGNIDDFLGGPTGLGDYANNYVTAQEMAMGEKPKADFSWDYLINGLPRDTGNLIGSGIGLAAPIAAATLAAPFVGVGATAAGIGGALAGAGLESMAEGGQKMRDSLANGDSLETAQDKARTVAGENMALLAPTNILGLGALKKVGQGLKTAYNGGKAVSATGGALANYPKLSQAVDFAKGAGWAGLGAMNEGAQEAWQQGIQDSVEPDTDWGILPWNWNDEQTEAFESTIGPTALMAGAGGGARLAARKLGMSDVPQVDTAPQVNNNLFGAGTAEISTQGADIDEQVAHLKDGYQSVIPQVAGVLVNDFGIEGAQISSAFRTREHNKEVGGVENSYHVGDGEHGDALDIVLPDGTSAETAEAIKQRFKNSGVFDEVLFHDAGSGYHLHLGGLKTDNIGNSYGSYSGNADVDSAINEMAEKYNLDPALLAAMAEQESGFNQSAQSEAGAMGIMQLMPGTAEELGVDPSDLRGNLEGGAKYLRQMLDMYDGDVEKALAAYNAGPGSLDSVNGDISKLSGETQKYVPSVMERYNKFKNKSGGGVSSSGNILDWDSTNEDFSKLDFFPKDGEQSQGTANEFLENLAKLEESDDKATKEKGRQAQDILQQYGDDTEKLTEKAKELGYQQTVNPAEVHGRIPMRRIVSTALNNGQVTFATKKAADIFASSPIGQTMERQGKTFKVTDNFKMNEQVNAISQQVYSDNTARTKTVKNGVMADAAAANRELNGQARPPIQQNDSVLTDEDRGRLISVMPNLPPQVQQQIQEALAENDIKAVRQLLDEATNSTPLNAETDIEKAKAITRALLQNPEATTSWDGNGAVRTAAIEGFINSNNLDGLNRANKYMAQNLRDKGINPLEVLNQNIEKPNTLSAVQGERMSSTDVQREEPAIESDHLNSEDFLAGLSPVERGFMEYLDKMFDNLQLGFNDVLEYLRARQKDIFNKRMESVIQQGPQGLTGAFYTNGGKMVVDNDMPQEVQNAWNQLLSMRKNFGTSLANSTAEIQNEYMRVESVVKDYLTTTVTEQCKNNVSWRKLNYAITGLEAIADKARRYERSVSEEGKRGSTKSYRDISAEEGQAIEDSAVAWPGAIHQYGTTETRLRSFLNTLGSNFTKNNHDMALRAKTKYKGQPMNKAGRIEALIRDGGRVEERGKEYFAVAPNGNEVKVNKGEHNYYKWLRQNGFAQQDRAPEGAPQLAKNNGVTEDSYRTYQPEYNGEESHEEYVKKEESTKGQTKPQSNDNPNASNEPMRKELIEQAAANEDTWVNSKKSELHLEDDNDTVVKLTPQELKYYRELVKKGLVKKGVVAKPELYEETQEDVGEMDDNVEMSKEQKQLYDESNGDRDVPDSDFEPHTSGKSTKVVTADGKEYNVHYEVRPESKITASNNLDGSVNKDYPSELQPRNRQRVGNLTQVAEIAGKLRPADLAENRMLNHGAPLIREDGVVLNGNGRIMAIRTAVKNGTDHGYKQYLIDHAEELGLNPDNIEHMENPVLVKVVDDELTADDVKAITTDTSGGQRMSASEQANIFEEPRAKYSREKSPVDEKNNQQENVTIEFEADTPAAQKVFDEQLTDEVKRNLRNTIAQQMTDTIKDFDALSDDVKADRAFSDLPIAKAMRVTYQIKLIQNNENNKSKIAARYEYARRCFLYDERVPNGINRPTAGNKQQKQMAGNLQEDVSKRNQRADGQRFANDVRSGSATPSLGEYKFIKKQFDKLVDDKLKHSSRDKSAFSIEPINPHSAESLKENGNSNTELDRLPKVPIAKLRQSEQKIVRFGKAIGVPVHFVESSDTTNRGVFTHNGEIFINRKAKVPAHSIFVHEFVHWLKASPENAGAYDVLHACLENYSGLFNEARINKYRNKIFDGEKMTDEEIVEEIICDAMTHTESAEKLMRAVNNVDGDLATRIAGCLKAMWDKFCKAIGFNPKILSRKQQLPNELSVTELQRADIAFNKILMNIKGNDGKPVFYRKGTELVLRETNAKPVNTYQVNPIGYTYAFASADNNPDRISPREQDSKYMSAVKVYQNESDPAKKESMLDKIRDMVQQAAKTAGFENAIPEQTRAYTVRTKPAPKKTMKVYKVFTVDDKGRPSALFVSSKDTLPQNVWLDANDTFAFTDNNNGRKYIPSTKNPNSKGGATGDSRKTENISAEELAKLEELGYIKRNKQGQYPKTITALAYRPGWHAGDLPFFPQGGKQGDGTTNYKNIHRYNQVVFECEIAYDKDYTNSTVNKKGQIVYSDRQEMPTDGGYKFATNPMTSQNDLGNWYISGSLKIGRALTEEECNKILVKNGFKPQEWQAYGSGNDFVLGKLDLEKLGYTGEEFDAARKTLAPITYDDNGNIIPLSQRFNPNINDVRYSRELKHSKQGAFLMPENGKPYTMSYYHNIQPSPKMAGDMFAQSIEPSGEYIAHDTMNGSNQIPGFEYGKISFKSPLVLEHKSTGHGGWKTDLSNMFEGKKGKALSNAIKKAGHDGIITIDSKTGEILETVNLAGTKNNGNKYSRGVDLSLSTDGVAIAARANNNLVANMKGIVKKANAKFNPFHHEELENLRIDKRDEQKDLNLIEYQFVSPTRESKKYKVIQPFVMKGKQAMDKQEKLRFEFNEGMNEVDKLLGWREGFHRNDSKFKERKEALNEILLKGDLEGKEFTNDELIKAGYDTETIKGYRKMRALLDKAWKLANDIKSRIKYQSITSSTLRRAEADFADLKDKNPFAEIISKVHNPDGTVTINYKAPHVRRVAKQTVLPSELENLRKNKDVHIVETTQSLKGTTQVTYYQREAGMGKLEGYIPHIFHGWYVCKVDKDGKAIVDEDGNVAMDNIMTTANSLSEAAKLGRELAKENPNANYRVVPQTFSAPGAQEQAIVMGDFDYAKIVGKVADSMSMSITDAQAMLDNTVKMKNRGRFYGYAKQRKGFKGFEQNVYLATMKYFNQTARYAAMDSFKRDSISMYNRIFGAFDDENVTKRSAMAKWTKQYISDMNGTPTWIEKMINNTLHNFGLGEERAGGRPALWLQQKIFTYPMTILKLGVFNPSSALLNLTQLFNLYGAMREKVLSPQAYQRLLHKGFADTFRAMSNKDSELGKLLWKELGLDYQIGMDIASGYSNAEVSNLASLRGFASRLAGKSMYLFRQSDAFVRGVTLLTAYNKALDEGKSKAEAIKYAKEINDKVNFDYSIADEPTIFRALGPISKVFLQFKKYPVKQLELFQDFYLDGRELGLNRKQAALRTLKYMAPYMAMSGMMGIPFISLAGGLLSALVATATGDDDWDLEKKIKQYMITEFGEDSPITQWWLYGAGSFIGLNLGSRVGVGDFMGSDSYNSADGLLGLAVNQTTLGSTIQQVSKQLSYRNYAEALKAINPTMGNIALAYKGEVRTTRGRMKYQYQNMAERMWRAIGFTPLNETLAGDLASNEYAEKQEQTKAKQEAVDDFLANPSSENATRLNELGVTPKSLENESARRTMNRHQLNELAKEKEAAKKKKKPKTYSASDYLKAVQ